MREAGLNRSQVSWLHFSLELDDFVPIYEVEWYVDGREYDYEVLAFTETLKR